ncbi:MAG: 3-dehydroquinate synthase [Slackia sp.]|nr:3-dehydroquinate synthase [Slackia sp.]
MRRSDGDGSMSVIEVRASRDYDVLVDECPIDSVGAIASTLAGDMAFVVSDSNVAPLYLGRVKDSLARAGFAAAQFVFPAGERSKTLATYGECLAAMAAAGVTRSSIVVALGGGVVGDMAGFAAATYMRGCRCIQVPTSLLACVDSSVGGKTAVDLPQGKNLVGAFFQPSAVLIDTTLLATLPGYFFTDGCAEIIKYGVIADADLLSLLEDPLTPGDDRLGETIARCVEIKRDIVQLDEHEGGLRRTLNFGHTIGHAIERASDFRIAHGHAVAAGMALMANACAKRGLCAREDAERVSSILAACGLPAASSFDARCLFEAARADKKRHGAEIDVVLMRGIGAVETATMDWDDFARLVEQACDGGYLR